jgi:A/G-specific adenine glycosylase
LDGVSEYIASAVRCFAWGIPEPLIDTNTVRVIGRVFMLEIKDSSRRNPLFRKLIGALLDTEQPRAYNYALLDLADQICTKKKPPDCTNCPVRRWCGYGTLALSMPGMLEVRRT